MSRVPQRGEGASTAVHGIWEAGAAVFWRSCWNVRRIPENRIKRCFGKFRVTYHKSSVCCYVKVYSCLCCGLWAVPTRRRGVMVSQGKAHSQLQSAPKYPERVVCLSSVLQGDGEEAHMWCRQDGVLCWERPLGHCATEVQMVSDIYSLLLVSTLSLDGPPLTKDLESTISWLSYLFLP